MRRVFADAVYWIAAASPRDQWAPEAKRAKGALGQCLLVTTDEVLIEMLTALRLAAHMRRQATLIARAIMEDPNVRVLPQSRQTFLRGLELYEQRVDKTYSLTDCISMQAMRAEGISDILTNDRHFEQEGFSVLMKRGEDGT